MGQIALPGPYTADLREAANHVGVGVRKVTGRTGDLSQAAQSAARLNLQVHKPQGSARISQRPSTRLRKAQWRVIADSLDLSDRQLEIVRCVFDGLDETSISRELDISHHTVHTYLDRLYRKVGVKSRCELIVRVFLAYLSRQDDGGTAPLNSPPRESQT
jgi:DNA-binding NarL/FixJ family response regulator